MYFLICFLSSFIFCFLFFKGIRKKQTKDFIKQSNNYLENDEKIIEYTSIKRNIEYTISSIIGFICYLLISVFIPNTLIRTFFSEIFRFDFIDLFLFVFFLSFVIVRSINIFSEFLIVSNTALTYIYKKEIKEKIKYDEIANIKYYPILPFNLSIKVLIITLKNGKKKIISDFENSKNICLNINKIINRLEA